MQSIVPILLISGLVASLGAQMKGHREGERMEMMAVWKLTEYLELEEEQADKFFPRMRSHRTKMDGFRKEVNTLLDPMLEKIREGEDVSDKEVQAMLKKLRDLDGKISQERFAFIESMGAVLTPAQQVKLTSFQGHFKQEIQDRMREHRRGSRKGDYPREGRWQKESRKHRFQF